MSYQQFAYYYDRLMADVPYDQWINFLSEYWIRSGKKPQSIVDLGCGTGNIAIPLAQDGFKVTAIDLSEDMLSAGQHKMQELMQSSPPASHESVTWLQQDMREWELPEQVDSVICFCDCLNYLLEEEDVKITFERVFQGLQKGGTFLFDVHSPRQLASYADEQPFMFNEDDIAYIWTCEVDAGRCEIEHSLTIFAKEQYVPGNADKYEQFNQSKRINRFIRFEEIHKQRAYLTEDLREWLMQTGYSKVDCYADFTWSAPTDLSQRIFFTATK